MDNFDNSFNAILQDVVDLPEKDKKELLDYLLNHFTPQDEPLNSVDTTELIEHRFSHGKVCPNCGSEAIVKNGMVRGRQRYMCKGCHKTFGDFKDTPVHASKKNLSYWLGYIKCMIEGLSLRKTAKKLEISVQTAFLWRHKVLQAIAKRLHDSKVDGIVETDETFFLESFKGNHKHDPAFVMPRKPRKRGGKAEKRGISNEQICVVCGIDRIGNIISDMTCKGRVSHKDLYRFFDRRIETDATICTDEHKSYIQFASDMGLKLVQIPSGKHKIGVYHIQHVNSYHSRLKQWMGRFQGVATKYLSNYLYWFKFLALETKSKDSERQKSLFIDATTTTEMTRRLDFKNLTPRYI